MTMSDDVLTNRWWASRIDCWLRFSPSTLKNHRSDAALSLAGVTSRKRFTEVRPLPPTTTRRVLIKKTVVLPNQIGTIPTTLKSHRSDAALSLAGVTSRKRGTEARPYTWEFTNFTDSPPDPPSARRSTGGDGAGDAHRADDSPPDWPIADD